VLCLFTALTVLFNYPVSTSPNSYLNDLTDPRLVTWSMAWNAHAYATGPLGLFDPNIYFPDESTKAWSETFLLPTLMVAPVNWAGYPVLAYNLVLLSSFVLCGLGATLWVRHITGSLSAGLLAGMIWAFAPGKFDQIAHLHMMVGQWIPFALLYCSRFLETGRPRYLYAMSLFAGVQFGFSMHFGVFLMPFLGLYAAALLVLLPQSAVRDNLAAMRRQLIIAAVIFGLLAAAVGLPFLFADSEVGLQRGYRETLAFSARPNSFLSGSTHNLAPHIARLHDRYHVEDASYFAGVVPFALAGFALLFLWPRALLARRASSRQAQRSRGTPWARARPVVCGASAAIAVLAFAAHFVSLVGAAQGEEGWAVRMAALSLTLHPALWAAVAATVAVLTMAAPGGQGTSRRQAYLIVVGYLTFMFYLFAYGPEVQAFGAQLGHGPYWLLYRLLLPFKLIRSAGRIGLLWVLCVAALAGFALAFVERRWARARPVAGFRRAWGVVLLVLLAVLVWEYRVWPLRHFPADPAADPADVWLAQQPGDFAIVHAPIETGPAALQETAYMLGSTLHWKKMVNGYLRFAPLEYRDLAATPQLGPEFFRLLRAGFPVRYMLVHEDRLAGEEQWARFEALLRPNDNATFLQQFGYTTVFDMPREGADAAPAEAGFGLSFRRDYSAAELAVANGVQFALRGSELAVTDRVIALAGWGERKEVVEITVAWRETRVALPAAGGGAITADLDGSSGAFEIWGHVLRPVGETGEWVVSGFVFDAARRGTTLGVGERPFYGSDSPALIAHRLERYGRGVLETRSFAPTAEGTAQMSAYLQGLPEGTLTAVSAHFGDFRVLGAELLDAFRLIGATPPAVREVQLVVALGVRGAEAGTALHHAHHTDASIHIDGPTPVLQVRGISLY